MLDRGYILGGLMWFAVPFTLATTLGLTGLALDLPLSAKEVSSGLVLPNPFSSLVHWLLSSCPGRGRQAEQQRFAAAAEVHELHYDARS